MFERARCTIDPIDPEIASVIADERSTIPHRR